MVFPTTLLGLDILDADCDRPCREWKLLIRFITSSRFDHVVQHEIDMPFVRRPTPTIAVLSSCSGVGSRSQHQSQILSGVTDLLPAVSVSEVRPTAVGSVI